MAMNVARVPPPLSMKRLLLGDSKKCNVKKDTSMEEGPLEISLSNTSTRSLATRPIESPSGTEMRIKSKSKARNYY